MAEKGSGLEQIPLSDLRVMWDKADDTGSVGGVSQGEIAQAIARKSQLEGNGTADRTQRVGSHNWRRQRWGVNGIDGSTAMAYTKRFERGKGS